MVDGGHHSTRSVALGVITTPREADIADRLLALRTDVVELLEEYRPHVVAVERIFFQVNVRTAMGVGQARLIGLQNNRP